MYRSILAPISLFGLLLMGACAELPAERDPFRISYQETQNRVDVIVLLPIRFSPSIRAPKNLAASLEDWMTQDLERAGFKVIPSSAYRAVYDPLVAESGGFFDPKTGERDDDKLVETILSSRKKMVNEHDVDAFLAPSVEVVRAGWNQNQATWHGAEEPTTGEECFACGFTAVADSRGNIAASSLKVTLTGADNELYYEQYGGIQLLSHYKWEGFVQVPEDQLFKDPARNKAAVALALGELVGRERPKKTAFETWWNAAR